MDDVLKYVFSTVNDWLKFAEQKSAMLIAVNGVVIFGLLKLVDSEHESLFIRLILSLIIILLSISLILCLSTFVPKLDMPWLVKSYEKSENDNLLYFGDIRKYTPSAYLNALRISLSANDQVTEFQRMISSQIIINSVISNYKFEVFKTAIYFFMTAFILATLFLLFQVWW